MRFSEFFYFEWISKILQDVQKLDILIWFHRPLDLNFPGALIMCQFSSTLKYIILMSNDTTVCKPRTNICRKVWKIFPIDSVAMCTLGIKEGFSCMKDLLLVERNWGELLR